MSLEYTYFEDDIAEKLMESFQLYGNMNYRYEPMNPWIIYGIADKEQKFFFTRGFSIGQSGETEYIFIYGNLHGLMKCDVKTTNKEIENKSVRYLKRLEILDIKGNTELDSILLEKVVRFYEETNAFDFEQQLCKKLNLKSHLLTNLNVIRQHEIMLKNREKWTDRNEILAEDFIFEPLMESDKEIFMDCIDKHSIDYSYFKNACMDYYMTDRNHSFKMIQCAYISDMIKRCDEPDDREYAIITENTSGTVLVWNYDDFRHIGGEIPIAHEKLADMCRYYKKFYYHFTELLKNSKN